MKKVFLKIHKILYHTIKWFKKVDVNEDGKITADEICQAVSVEITNIVKKGE